MSRNVSIWGRLAGSALVFAVLVWRLGTGPFLDGLRTIDGIALAAAAVLVGAWFCRSRPPRLTRSRRRERSAHA